MKFRALFQIFLMISSIFSVSFLAPAVKGDEQKVCCSETVDGEYCQYIERSKCKVGSIQASTSCEQTSYCKLGCGFDGESGRCFKNTPKFTCQNKEGCVWTDNPDCDNPQCQKGCCVLSNQCSFVTQLQCKRVTSKYKDVEMTFDESVGSEFECINTCRSFERGACVKEDASCVFTTRESCDVDIKTVLNATGVKVGFHPSKLCSNPQLGTECAAQQYTGCLPDQDEVYWFDSCGNAENIYSSDKRQSYNNGFVLTKEESCNLKINNVNSETCGNCNFALGSLCGEAGKGVDPKYGDYSCIDLSCKDITVSQTSPASVSGSKKLGESWCAYDGVPGFGRDFVGSRHYRRICINGEELTEPCKDYREEVCIQGVQGQPPMETQESFSLKSGDYVQAICRENRHPDCTEMENQLDCENLQLRDCYWIGSREEERGKQKKNENGKCVPLVSPGFKFWSGESTGETSNLDAKSTCEKGNQECKVTYERPGLFGDVFSGGFGDRGWKCISNCQCLGKEYLQGLNNVCKSLGDCGAWFNIKGRFTEDGFVEDSGADLTSRDVESYDSLVSPKKGKGEYDNKFRAFFQHSAPGLVIVGLTGGVALLAGEGFSFFTIGLRNIYGGFGDFSLKGLDFGTGIFEWVGEQAHELFTGIGGGVSQQTFKVAGDVAVKEGVKVAGKTMTEATLKDKFAIELKTAGFKEATPELIGKETNKLLLPEGRGYANKLINEEFQSVLSNGLQSGMSGPEAAAAAEKAVGDFANKMAKENIGKLNKQAMDKVAAQNNLVRNAEGEFVPQGPGLFEILNTIAWIYTIYSLLDMLLADTKTETIIVTCEPWQAPPGGEDCEKCDEEGKECSEYRCKSLGQMCKLLNPGTEKEACVAQHPNDVSPPIIKADSEALERGYTLTEVGREGFTLDQEIEPFTPVSLGIKTNEYAQCKFSLSHSDGFDKMTNYFGDSNYAKEHDITFGLSSILTEEEALKLTNGGQYSIYVRCQDGNGNKNKKSYYIKFKIKKGPDMTAPVIETTSIANGAYIPAGANETVLTIYTNEPSECRWDYLDSEYEKMNNDFACTSSRLPTSSIYYGLYDCTTILKNLKNTLNTFYFRCKDKENNYNSESYIYRLIGTIPLEITSISPEPGTKFYRSNVTVKVVTAKGAQGGTAVCGYDFDKGFNNAIEFLNTNSSVHEQLFENLIAQDYEIYIGCRDIAGNFAAGNTSFKVMVDKGGPNIENIYTEGSILHLVTDEISTCEFSTTGSFKFGSGTPMSGEKTKKHETILDGSIYYIVCRDEYDNEASYKVFV